eukprot:m.4251 g.4251  ORF g.4251 m.4251 type:complete len:368 (-) comp4443_c0_seq1:192-1295(-)
MWEVDILFDFATETVIHVPTSFRSAGIVILFLYCWSWNIRGFDSYQIPFRRLLDLTTASADDVATGAKTLLAILLLCFGLNELFAWLDIPRGQAFAQLLYYTLFGYLLLLSNVSMFVSARHFVAERIKHFVTLKPVHFVDVLTADALTSMSKLLADSQIMYCTFLFLAGTDHGLNNKSCLHSLAGPSLASIPYAIRAIQCYVAFKNTGEAHHLANLGKYLSSFPVIWTSALKHQLAPIEGVQLDRHDQHLQVLWLYTVTINTLYSFLWDILMDWGLCRDATSSYPLLRHYIVYRPWKYYAAMVVDLALRLCWSLKLSSHLQQHASGRAFVFVFEVLEVLRRFMWNYFRVEWQFVRESPRQTHLVAVA